MILLFFSQLVGHCINYLLMETIVFSVSLN